MKKTLVIALFILAAVLLIGSAVHKIASAAQKYTDKIAEVMPK